MRKPTKVELDGCVGWDRYEELKAMSIEDFYNVPVEERCGAWILIDEDRKVMMDAFDGLVS